MCAVGLATRLPPMGITTNKSCNVNILLSSKYSSKYYHSVGVCVLNWVWLKTNTNAQNVTSHRVKSRGRTKEEVRNKLGGKTGLPCYIIWYTHISSTKPYFIIYFVDQSFVNELPRNILRLLYAKLD